MPAAAHCRVNTSAVYWLPRSECNTTPCAARAVTAISSADCTRSTVCRALMAQPTTFRLNTSSTVARYTNPSSVGTYVMSATHKRFGSEASKRRWTRSGATVACGSLRVVQRRFRRVTPCKPSARISRATRRRDTVTPCARSSAHTRRAP